MATIKNTYDRKDKGTQRELATDEAGMMSDAKDYAKKDMSTVLGVLERLQIEVNDEKMEMVASALILVKYEQIDNARNNRPSYMKFFED